MRFKKTTFELNCRWNCSFCNLENVLCILPWRKPAAFCWNEAHHVL